MSVYFVTCREQGICKIGHSQNAKARRSNLQTAFSSKLVLEAELPGSAELERELHQRFAKDRLRGEWFTITEGLEALIAEAATVVLVPQKSERSERKSDEERIEESIALHRRLLSEGMVELDRLGSVPTDIKDTPRLYSPVNVAGGQFTTRYAIRPLGEHRILCADLGLTWDQADRLCDILHAERQRELRLPAPEPETRAA